MSNPNENHIDSKRVKPAERGDGVFVFTPCHGAEVFHASEQAVAAAKLDVVCPEGGEGWLVELVADEGAESGLRAVWTVPDQEGEGA